MSKRAVRKRKKGYLAENYRKCWEYLRETKNFTFIIIGIFFAFVLIGFFVPAPPGISDQLLSYIKSIVEQISGFSTASLIGFIFLNNVKSSLLGWILGILLGIFPVLFSLFNGYVLGFVSKLSVEQGGVFVLWRLLPHGIFELPAVFISLGMGMKLGSALISDRKRMKENFLNSLRVFVSIVIPLLIIAAIIEGILISVLG